MTKADIFKVTLALYRVTNLFPKKEPLRFSLRRNALKIYSSLSLSKESSELLSRAERANIIRADLIYLDNIFSLFQIAKRQEWVDSRNFLILEEEYQKLKLVLREHYSKMKEAQAGSEEQERGQPESKKEPDEPLSIFQPEQTEAKKTAERKEPENERKDTVIVDISKNKAEDEERRDTEIKREFIEKSPEVSPLEKKMLDTLRKKGKMRTSQLQELVPDLKRRSLQRKLNDLRDKNLVDVSGNGPQLFYFYKS